MQLTPHFSLEEFTRSPTAQRLNIPNNPDAKQIENLRNLCAQILEPLRTYIRSPVIISSGFRCKELNAAVGGVANSQHLKGEAADIRCKDSQLMLEWAAWIRDNCNFDQLILEISGTSIWLHVSCKYDIGQNRHQVKRIVKT